MSDHTRRHASANKNSPDTDLLTGHFTQLNDAGEPSKAASKAISTSRSSTSTKEKPAVLTGAKVGDTFMSTCISLNGHDDLGKMPASPTNKSTT